MVITFLNGVAGAIRKYEPQLWNAGWNIASAIIDGMVNGIENFGKHILDKIEHLISSLPSAAKHLLGIHSPSTVFMEIGQNIVEGLTNGIGDNADQATSVVQDMTDNMVASIQTIPSAIMDALDFKSPTITPVLDLSKIEEGAKLIPGYMPPVDFSPLHLLAAAGQSGSDGSTATDTGVGGMGITNVSFVQNNTSPESLSAIDIYRATKNQISQLSTLSSDAAYFANQAGK